MSSALEAIQVSNAALPIIDIGGLSSSSLADRKAVAERLRAACLDNGFFYIANHGVSAALIDALFEETRRFFDSPAAAKSAVDKSLSFCARGFEPMRAQTLEAGAPADLKESFYIGPELPLDDPRVLARRFNHDPNLWPAGMPNFRPVAEAYFDTMLGLSQRLISGLALALDLDEDYFAAYCTNPHATLRLLQDDVGGLQVQGKTRDEWIHATPIPGTFVVNLGDLIARWTNDRFRSTVHRVVNASGRERYSVPFFFSGNPDQQVECLPSCLEQGGVAKYPPTTVEGHLREMYRRTYK
jgi:isopenicillin N synthase-like dioxygenase